MRRRGPSAMDDADLRETARAAIDPDELENLIRVGEAMIERAKDLVKAAEVAIHASQLLAIEARQIRADRPGLRAANPRPTGARTDPYERRYGARAPRTLSRLDPIPRRA